MRINEFLMGWIPEFSIFVAWLAIIFGAAGCATNLRDVIVGTPPQVRIISGEVSSETVSLVNDAFHALVVVTKCEGVTLQYVGESNKVDFDQAVPEKTIARSGHVKTIGDDEWENARLAESGKVIESFLWSYDFPITGAEDTEGSSEEIQTCFSGQFGIADVNPFLYKTQCYAIPFKEKNDDLLFVKTYYHTERLYVDQCLSRTPSRLTLFQGVGHNDYRKILDFYTNIPDLQVRLINGVWYVKTGYASDCFCWKIVFDSISK